MLNGITTDYLNTITGTFSLTGLTVLSNLQMNSLSGVNSIYWVTLPQLQALNFGVGVTKANQVYISDTQLSSLSGIELQQVGNIDINNNFYLNTVNVNNLVNVTSAMSFSANGPSLDIALPNMLNAANLTFRNVTSVEMPSLANVPGAMGFYSDMFANFSAPNLTTIGQSLAFVDCSNLQSISFPSLTTIGGGFLLSHNPQLAAIDQFPSLTKIQGAIDFAGSFSSVRLPNLTTVRGGANVQTTSTNSSICQLFNSAHQHGAIQGNVNCSTGVTNPQNNGTSTGSSSGSTSSKNAAPLVGYNPAAPFTGIAALVAALFFL